MRATSSETTSPLTTSERACLASDLISSSGRPSKGKGKMIRRRSGSPLPLAAALARFSKNLVWRLTVGMPLFSSSALSWIHHAVQDPQLPSPTMTA